MNLMSVPPNSYVEILICSKMMALEGGRMVLGGSLEGNEVRSMEPLQLVPS